MAQGHMANVRADGYMALVIGAAFSDGWHVEQTEEATYIFTRGDETVTLPFVENMRDAFDVLHFAERYGLMSKITGKR
ncbi:hypothetical protein [Nonomuraea sp. SYSU D8015]|uniref:hypothetical protein n=1 Tax=Nonomuraea sp. SYSU D8015 TaxID=2593644 RepID=UPI001660B1B2|nr:hypothetical protein [Nonomuraea sp. SYSU D8015]